MYARTEHKSHVSPKNRIRKLGEGFVLPQIPFRFFGAGTPAHQARALQSDQNQVCKTPVWWYD